MLLDENVTKQEKSLLLYLETCIVDHGSLVDLRHMNGDDHTIVEEWKREKFIDFGRVRHKDIKQTSGSVHSHWCTFSEGAWDCAHQERKARARRLFEKRTWQKTSEKNL